MADPVRRFSRVALALVIVAVGTGVLNAGLVLPALQSLWESIYGKVLLLKVLVLTPVLALATFHRLSLRRAIARLGAVTLPGWSIRLETALALTVVLGGSLLTLMAPPGTGADTPLLSHLDLAAPIPSPDGSLGGRLHLELQPAKPGRNAVVVRLATAEDTPVEQVAAMPRVEVTFLPLDHAAAKTTVTPEPDALGAYAIGGVDLPGEGWWQANVVVTPPAGDPTGATFFFALPDPNVTGHGPAPAGSDPTAEAALSSRSGLDVRASPPPLHTPPDLRLR